MSRCTFSKEVVFLSENEIDTLMESLPCGEIADNHLRAQCPECGAHRELLPVYEEGAVYKFPLHNQVTRHENLPAWRRANDTWKWHTVEIQASIL